VDLPVNPPILPMLAKRVDELPARAIGFSSQVGWFSRADVRDGDEIFIQSREKTTHRYFPELLEPLRATLPARCVLDGEMIIVKIMA